MSLPENASRIHPSIAKLSPAAFFKECCDHEAGHYVMLHLLDLWFIPRFACAKTIRDEYGGVVCFDFDGEDFSLEKRILEAAGGLAAQAEGIFSRRPDITPGHPELNEINERLLACADTDFKLIKSEFGVKNVDDEIMQARLMLRANWQLVEALSRELSAGNILYSDEPRIIVEIARGDKTVHARPAPS